MRSASPLTVLAVVLGLPIASCAHAGGSDASGAPAPDPLVELDLTNNTWSDVDVFAIYENTATRIGSVTSQTTEVMSMPSTVWAAGQIQIRVEPMALGPVLLTDPIYVRGGERIRLTVEHQVGLSHWTVEDRSYNW